AAFRIFFTFVVPVAFLTTVPAEAMLGRSQVTWVIGAGILALVLFFVSSRFWRFALRYYTSASS
ncbi:MAG: ABC-2 family transporter protein, partial [Cyanobacteria bacterium J06573_2]